MFIRTDEWMTEGTGGDISILNLQKRRARFGEKDNFVLLKSLKKDNKS